MTSMKTWKIWTLAGLIFCCGVAAGALGLRLATALHLIERIWGPPPEPTETDILARIDREVGLNDAQKQEILPILRTLVGRIREMHRETRPRMDALFEEADTAVAARLDPAQRERFETFLARMRARRPPPPRE